MASSDPITIESEDAQVGVNCYYHLNFCSALPTKFLCFEFVGNTLHLEKKFRLLKL